MNKKILALSLSIVMGITTALSTGTVFATNVTETTKEKKEKPENEIIGKIVSIDATNVVISVATRKASTEKREKLTDEEKAAKKAEMDAKKEERKASGDTTSQKPEKPNEDDKYTLTGETKTINIAAATFGVSVGKSKDNTTNTSETTTQKTKTYADYAVGDYITIECTDSTYAIAKKIRGTSGHGGGKGGKGGQQGKQQSEKK